MRASEDSNLQPTEFDLSTGAILSLEMGSWTREKID